MYKKAWLLSAFISLVLTITSSHANNLELLATKLHQIQKPSLQTQLKYTGRDFNQTTLSFIDSNKTEFV